MTCTTRQALTLNPQGRRVTPPKKHLTPPSGSRNKEVGLYLGTTWETCPGSVCPENSCRGQRQWWWWWCSPLGLYWPLNLSSNTFISIVYSVFCNLPCLAHCLYSIKVLIPFFSGIWKSFSSIKVFVTSVPVFPEHGFINWVGPSYLGADRFVILLNAAGVSSKATVLWVQVPIKPLSQGNKDWKKKKTNRIQNQAMRR